MIILDDTQCEHCGVQCWTASSFMRDLDSAAVQCWSCSYVQTSGVLHCCDDCVRVRSYPSPLMAMMRPDGSLEISDKYRRVTAVDAMKKMWDALQLGHKQVGIVLPGIPSRNDQKARMALWVALATAALGDDAPFGEEPC